MKNQEIFIFIARDYICCAAVAQWESVRLKTEMSSVQIRPAAPYFSFQVFLMNYMSSRKDFGMWLSSSTTRAMLA